MMANPAPAEPDRPEVTEEDVDYVIDLCGGDARAAVRTLLIAGQHMERELDEARQEASWGYVRARPSRKAREAS